MKKISMQSLWKKAFTEIRFLVSHLKIHTGVNHIKCSHCDKNASTKKYLKTHLQTRTGEKPHQCNQCGKSSRNTHLKSHMRTHTGEKPYHPYECNHCKKKCPSPSKLKTCMMTHTDEKPYQCNHCGKAFTVNKSLINHLRIYLGKNYINAAIVTEVS